MKFSHSTRRFYLTVSLFIFIIPGCQTSKGPMNSDQEQKPTIKIISPLNHAFVSGMVKITFLVSDQNKDTTRQVELWVNNKYSGLNTRTAADSLQWNTIPCEDGSEHSLMVKLYLDSVQAIVSNNVFVVINNFNPPRASELDSIKYSMNTFSIIWSKNTSQDFKSYSLYESLMPDMSDSLLIYYSENLNDTSCTISGITDDEYRFYKLVVSDSSGLTAAAAIKSASTSTENGFVQFYFKIWKDLFLTRNQISEDYFNAHVEIISRTISEWNNGISFNLYYMMHVAWAEIEGHDNFMIMLLSTATEYHNLSVRRDVYLTKEEVSIVLDNRVFGSSIGKVNPVENLLYASYEQSVAAFQAAVNCDKIFPQQIAYYVPGKLPRIDGDPYFLGFGTLDSLNNRCISGYFNLLTGSGSAHETVCIIIN